MSEENVIEKELVRFEFNITGEEENLGFLTFQKRHVYKKNIIQTVGFSILALGFAYSIYRVPDAMANYILFAICLAVIASIWYNSARVRHSLVEAMEMLCDDKYIFKLYEGEFEIETILPDDELEDGEEPIKPLRVNYLKNTPDVIENESLFVIIRQDKTVHVLPKRCMDSQCIELVREKLNAQPSKK